MLGFILSKMNLLIMVTAIFAIMAYFMIFVNQGTIGRQANAILTNMIEETQGVISSSGQCHQSIVRIPRYIQTVGTTSPGGKVRFTVRINKIAQGTGTEKIVSYSIWVKKGSNEEAVAAKPFSTTAEEVYLYPWEKSTSGLVILSPNTEISFDPNGQPPADSLMLIKEVYLGRTYLYLFPCSSEGGGGGGDHCRTNYLGLNSFQKQEPIKNRTPPEISCANPFPTT